MKVSPKLILLIVVCLGIGAALYFSSRPRRVLAQTDDKAAQNAATNQTAPAQNAASNISTNATASPTNALSTNVVAIATNAAPTNVPPPAVTGRPTPGAGFPGGFPGPGQGQPLPETEPLSPTDEIQLSFQGANIEMIVQWLAKATGKSVVKHPRVQCQLTIVSSKKLSVREAINLVYRALALEGFAAIESSNSILIVPEGSEPKMSPQMVESAQKNIPEGRQKLLKLFQLKHLEPNEIKDKIRPLLSEKATIEVADRSNQLIVTDYTDNIRLLTEFIEALDVPSPSDTAIEFYPLKHSEAEELGNLLTLILNAQSPPPGGSSSSSSSSRPSPRPPGGPDGGPMIMPPGGPSPSPGGSSSSSGGASAQAGNQVKIWPDKTANRLIVAAPKSKQPEIKNLVDVLDTEKPQDVALRVIPLKNVTAEDLVKEIGPLYQKMSGRSLKDVIEIAANNRSNSLIVLSSESNYKSIEALIARLDTEEAQEKVLRAFPLKNADAEDVAKQLQELNQDQDSSSRYPFYIFSSSMNRGGSSKKPSIVADKRRNAVMVQAPPGAMENIAKLIKTLDEPLTDSSLSPKIFRLKYVSAVDIEDVLNELFLKKQQQRSYWYYDDFYPQQNVGNDAGKLYGKVRITSEPYSNSIIVTSNSPENLAAVEEILKQLDSPSEAGETTLRVQLKFAKAINLANAINILFAKQGSPGLRQNPQQQQPQNPGAIQQPNAYTQSNFGLEEEVKEDVYYPWLGGQQENQRGLDGRNTTRPVSDLVGRVRMVPDKRSNSLLVTSNVHFLTEIMKLIDQLDIPTAQVMIEAKIVEVSGDFRDRLGVRWSPDGSQVFDTDDLDNSIIVKNRVGYTNVFAGTPLANALQTGVLSSSANLDVLIQFLRKNTDSKVLAEPQLNIADNELGKLFVGAQVPFISGTLTTDVGAQNNTFQYRDVGIILEVTPHINDSNEIALRIRAESSNIRPGVLILGGAVLETRNFKTELMVKAGETVVLGGIIQREAQEIERKVPGLGSIPGFGWAFKKKDKVDREVELLVFLRPHIARSPEEAARMLEEVKRKTPLIQDWQNETNGYSRPVEKSLKEKEKEKN